MAGSSFSNVLRFILGTWVFYLLILFFIDAITPQVKRIFGATGAGPEIMTLIAGMLILAPFIVLWDWYVLDRYYPSRVKELSKREASQLRPQSA